MTYAGMPNVPLQSKIPGGDTFRAGSFCRETSRVRVATDSTLVQRWSKESKEWL